MLSWLWLKKKCSLSKNMHIGIYILVYTKYLFFSSKMDITPKSVLASSAKGSLIYQGEERFLNMKQCGLYCLLWESQFETTLNPAKLKKLNIML